MTKTAEEWATEITGCTCFCKEIKDRDTNKYPCAYCVCVKALKLYALEQMWPMVTALKQALLEAEQGGKVSKDSILADGWRTLIAHHTRLKEEMK